MSTNPVEMQSISEQEGYVEGSSIAQNNQTMLPFEIESDNRNIQFNREADNLPVQYITEDHAVSNL